MLNSVIIGQYVPGDSIIHKLDPRTKIIIIFFYVIVVFFANNAWSYGLLTLFVLLAIIITRIPLRFILKGLTPIWFLIFLTFSFSLIFKSLTPIWFLIFFTFVLHLFLTKEGPVVFEWGIFTFYLGGIIQGAIISLRFLLLILMTSLLTLTTTPIEITDAIEAL